MAWIGRDAERVISKAENSFDVSPSYLRPTILNVRNPSKSESQNHRTVCVGKDL